MAFTATDLSNAESALAEYMLGNRTGSVSINGKTIQYSELKDGETSLLNYISMIKRSLGQTPTRAYARNCKLGSI